ncbi:uncharacterized protein LOC131953802 [Physella acuta]|uniref:uncharacterized protein LOC131953802 n=1 Tax=Physella acuta TaxID=109671 RepID=UPI0027DD93FD|nr:uncharacterized protein LOC131953802 [Physella acuta]
MSVLFKFCVACIASVVLAGKQNEVPKNNCEKEADCFFKNVTLYTLDPSKFDSRKYEKTCGAQDNLKTCLKNIKNKCKTKEWQDKVVKLNVTETFVIDLCSESGNVAIWELYENNKNCLKGAHVPSILHNCTTELNTCFRSEQSYSLRCYQRFKYCVADSVWAKCGLRPATFFGDMNSIYLMSAKINSVYPNGTSN